MHFFNSRWVRGNHERGASLVEVLVAMLITTVGLLGFAGLQSRALVATEDSYLRTQAISLGQDILERMRMSEVGPAQQSNAGASGLITTYANSSYWTSGSIPVTENTCFGATANCNAVTMAQYDVMQVRSRVVAMLPQGSIVLRACPTGEQICVYVAWGDTTATDCANANGMIAGGLAMQQCVVVQGT